MKPFTVLHLIRTGCMQENREGRIKWILASAFAGTTVLFLASLFVGKYPLTLNQLLEKEEQALRVFLTLRLPRTSMALLGGFALGIAGNVYQTVFRNPLAAPDIIGVSSGASAGAAFGILFLSSGTAAVTFSAFLGALTAVLLTLSLAGTGREKGNASIVLSGIAVHALAQTMLMVLKLTADPEKELSSIEYWMMGSLGGITSYRMPVTVLVCLGALTGIFLLRRQVLLLSVEDEESRMLGVDVGKIRLMVLLLATLLVAAVISVTGLISFVGLLAPHTARLLAGKSRSSVMLLGGLMGSILLITADMLARGIAAGELPVSIFTSLLGAPFLLYLMAGKGKAYF